MIAAWFTGLGHMIRDGWPKLPRTFLARLAGGAAVTAGCLAVADATLALILGSAVFAGFYTDMRHGEGALADDWADWRDLAISGVTSLGPLIAAAAWLVSPWWGFGIAAGLLKPPIWIAAWELDPGRFAKLVPAWAAGLTEPTRIAAVAWGALVGVLVTAIATS